MKLSFTLLAFPRELMFPFLPPAFSSHRKQCVARQRVLGLHQPVFALLTSGINEFLIFIDGCIPQFLTLKSGANIEILCPRAVSGIWKINE